MSDDQELRAFVRERDWDQFHSSREPRKTRQIEAGEPIAFSMGEDTIGIKEELADHQP